MMQRVALMVDVGSPRTKSDWRGRGAMTAALVTLHVASDAESLSASGLRAHERLLASVAVTVDPQATRSRKGLVARLANVSVLGRRKVRL